MTVPLSNTKLRVPNGFPGLLEAFTREVLRSQPENIFDFGATYFEKLMSPKDEVVEKPTDVESESKDRFYNNDSFKTDDFDPSNPQQQDAALKIQTKYRQHAAKKEVQHLREDQAAVKIQAGVRGMIDRQKVKQEVEERKTDQQENSDDKENVKKQEKETLDSKEVSNLKETSGPKEADANDVIDIDLNDPDVQNAAVKIQAGFKGLKARKAMSSSKMTDELKGNDQPKTEEENKPEVETAAEIKETTPEESKAEPEPETKEPETTKEQAPAEHEESKSTTEKESEELKAASELESGPAEMLQEQSETNEPTKQAEPEETEATKQPQVPDQREGANVSQETPAEESSADPTADTTGEKDPEIKES